MINLKFGVMVNYLFLINYVSIGVLGYCFYFLCKFKNLLGVVFWVLVKLNMVDFFECIFYYFSVY